jgi:hypothetical protein
MMYKIVSIVIPCLNNKLEIDLTSLEPCPQTQSHPLSQRCLQHRHHPEQKQQIKAVRRCVPLVVIDTYKSQVLKLDTSTL